MNWLLLGFYLLEFLLIGGIAAFVVMQIYIIWRGAPYMPSTDRRAGLMVDALRLKKGDKAADLGSGNGLMLIEMAKRGIEAHGFEINPYLVLFSRWKIARARLSDKAIVHWRDFWSEDLSEYKGLTVYLLPHITKRLEPKLKREMKKGSRVVVETWKLPKLKPERVIENYVFVYKF